jgi:hypothetical protein
VYQTNSPYIIPATADVSPLHEPPVDTAPPSPPPPVPMPNHEVIIIDEDFDYNLVFNSSPFM